MARAICSRFKMKNELLLYLTRKDSYEAKKLKALPFYTEKITNTNNQPK